jgi:hypothetical protein
MSHSIAQELSMILSLGIEEAEDQVANMRDRVIEGDDPATVLEENGLEAKKVWINELSE